ncbi:MAG: LON peptidase substrate-binding domain-containing protein [Hyphomicrobiaceae bacterium]|nr:LON peptidase substrate-binding domain-containing protein [Hyphomicrobiaceae bacterium]
MTQAGNQSYPDPSSIPTIVPVFPLPGALLLPRGQMPLNIFEPRYVEMIDRALAGDRVIGMIQPRPVEPGAPAGGPQPLMNVGCLGRIVEWNEAGDGRYGIILVGIARFQVIAEVATDTPYRLCRINAAPFAADFARGVGDAEVDRKSLLSVFRSYLSANELDTDWDNIERTDNETLVNALSMLAPYGTAEKQALLEAPDLKTRAATLVALTEVALARAHAAPATLQ